MLEYKKQKHKLKTKGQNKIQRYESIKCEGNAGTQTNLAKMIKQ